MHDRDVPKNDAQGVECQRRPVTAHCPSPCNGDKHAVRLPCPVYANPMLKEEENNHVPSLTETVASETSYPLVPCSRHARKLSVSFPKPLSPRSVNLHSPVELVVGAQVRLGWVRLNGAAIAFKRLTSRKVFIIFMESLIH